MRPEDLLHRIDQLLEQAEEVAATKREPAVLPSGRRVPGGPLVDKGAFRRWSTSSLHALRLTFGEGSDHYAAFRQQVDEFRGYFDTFESCWRILQAARDDLAAGMLVSIQELAAVDVFGDLLEMAEYLHGERYHLPAAAVAGAVLEDSLRKLCARHGVTWTGHSSISLLNDALHKAQVYTKTQWRQIQAWGDLRNAVDHHNFTDPADIDPNDVKRMIEGVRDFIVKYLT